VIIKQIYQERSHLDNTESIKFAKQKIYLVWGTARQGMQLLIITDPRLSSITCRRQHQSCKQIALAAMQGQAAGACWCKLVQVQEWQRLRHSAEHMEGVQRPQARRKIS